MTHVASLELCQQLYDLSGWGETLDAPVRDNLDWYGANKTYTCPKYPLGYLLRKLPKKLDYKKDRWGLLITPSTTDGSWIVDYLKADWGQPLASFKDHWMHNGDRAVLTEADTPEDAAAKLCIELIKQGVLPKGEDV